MAAASLADISAEVVPLTGALSSLKPGQEAVIAALATNAEPGVRSRLLSLGFVPGTLVKVVRRAPFADPTEYELRGGRISLRRSEADLITISG